MSLLLRDQVRIGLCADKLIAVRLGRGLGPRVIARAAWPVDPDHGDAVAANMLDKVLAQKAWQGADVAVILSNHFTRLQLLPWTDTVLDASERQAFAHHAFQQAYGERARSLELRLATPVYGEPVLASGIDTGLLAAIREAMPDNCRLVSIRPFVASAVHQWRRQLGPAAQWFVVVEGGVMCSLLLQARRIVGLGTRRVGDNWEDEIELSLHRLRLANPGLPATSKVSVFAPADEQAPGRESPGFTRLDMADAQFAMPLAGVRR